MSHLVVEVAALVAVLVLVGELVVRLGAPGLAAGVGVVVATWVMVDAHRARGRDSFVPIDDGGRR